jgi:hypothetical protein
LVRGINPWIRIHTKISWIRNTAQIKPANKCTVPLSIFSQVAYLRVDLSMELAVEDFSGGELVEELILSWFEIIELVITFFCCKK